MGCLAWLVAMAGIGGASVFFAVSAPAQAWWVLGLVVVALLAGPHLTQWWLSRARRTERLAARWWAGAPGPIEVAFLCGGPDRVVDVVIADLVAEGLLTVDDEGKLAGGELRDPFQEGPEADFRRQVLTRLTYGNTDVATLRFSTRSTAAMPVLWRDAVRHQLLLPSWRREYTPWYVAGALVTIGYCAGVALSRTRPDTLDPFVVGVTAVGLGVVALWRPKHLVGYEFDPRTAAGRRAATLAHAADRPGDRRHHIAVEGIRSVSDLSPGAPGPSPPGSSPPGPSSPRPSPPGSSGAPGPPGGRRVPPSRWHVPWYARKVHEEGAPWWHEVAQATTDYSETLSDTDGPAE